MQRRDSPGTDGDGVSRTISEWKAACETGDGDRATALLSPDVVLHSPLVDGVPFVGPAQAGAVLVVALPLFSDVRFSTGSRCGWSRDGWPVRPRQPATGEPRIGRRHGDA